MYVYLTSGLFSLIQGHTKQWYYLFCAILTLQPALILNNNYVKMET